MIYTFLFILVCDFPAMKQSLIHIYILVSSILAVLIFLYGYFPIKNEIRQYSNYTDLPRSIHDLRVNRNVLYKPHIGRLIFVLIDAFRWDFLSSNMPYTSSLVEKGEAISTIARCHPPTATMPRLKALMTGSIPNYIDVALNLGSQEVLEDNLILQATSNDLKILFYGDETWQRLFPDKFLRSEGTTSFFVSDFTEVDVNVTRHISRELKSEDWDILILHYLGLDHIGHLAGPSSDLVPPKLKEMDDVISELHQGLLEWDNKNPERSSLIVVAGDHGMHLSGSHGGASLEEILVSLVFIGKGFSRSRREVPEVSQIDVAATLSVLLGLPIPHSSLGAIIPEALKILSTDQYLYALYYNAQHVAKRFSASVSNAPSHEHFKMFLEAEELHASLLRVKPLNTALKIKLEELYFHSTRGMSQILADSFVKFDFIAISCACLVLIEVLLIMVFSASGFKTISYYWEKSISIHTILKTTLFLTAVGAAICFMSCSNSLFCFQSWKYFPLSIFTVLLHSLNVRLLISIFRSFPSFLNKAIRNLQDIASLFLYVGCILQSVSLASSSFIEEEHQVWYFLWVTFGLIVLFGLLRNSDRKSNSSVIKMALLLSGHRILRKLNQTGDKWAFLPDLGDWINHSDHSAYLFLFTLLGLVGTWVSVTSLSVMKSTFGRFLYGLTLLVVLLYRTAVGDVTLPFHYTTSRGVNETNAFWFLWSIILIWSVFLFLYKQTSLNALIKICASALFLTSALLLRPHNTILIPTTVLMSKITHDVISSFNGRILAHVWIGAVGYYYQGNSNNLATVDIAAGYIGAEDYQMSNTAILIAVHTYCIPISATLLLWSKLTDDNSSRSQIKFLSSLKVLTIHRLFSLSFYFILSAFHYRHLFVWTVFAPKLLYESIFSVIFFTLIIFGYVIGLFLK